MERAEQICRYQCLRKGKRADLGAQKKKQRGRRGLAKEKELLTVYTRQNKEGDLGQARKLHVNACIMLPARPPGKRGKERAQNSSQDQNRKNGRNKKKEGKKEKKKARGAKTHQN